MLQYTHTRRTANGVDERDAMLPNLQTQPPLGESAIKIFRLKLVNRVQNTEYADISKHARLLVSVVEQVCGAKAASRSALAC